MNVDHASLSLLGDRDENQDAIDLIERDDAVFAIVIDGMGGHQAGALAAQHACASLRESFDAAELPIFDPRGFLRTAVGKAHDAVVTLGTDVSIGAKPRATCVVVLIQRDKAYWAHVGDSRVYLIRDGEVADRTRDHSHIEILLQEGLISEDEYREHPLRNYVEYCLGGEPGEPTMGLAGARQLQNGDVIVMCSDGLWSGCDDSEIAATFDGDLDRPDLATALRELSEGAVAQCAPAADNTSAIVLRWAGL